MPTSGTTASPGAPATRARADYVRRRTDPGDRVLVWSDPLVHYLSGRASIGRFAFHVPLSAPARTEHHRRFRREFLADLDRTRPRLIAVGRRHLEVADSLNEADIGRRFPELRERLASRYAEVARFGDMVVYQRRAVPPSP